MAVLGVLCCSAFFCSCSEWGPLSSCGEQASHCGGFSCWRALLWLQKLQHMGSVVAAPRLWSTGSVVAGLSWAQMLHGIWEPPGPRIKPPSPALAGGSSPLSHEGNPEISFKLLFVPQLYHPIGGRKSPSPGFKKQRSRL